MKRFTNSIHTVSMILIIWIMLTSCAKKYQEGLDQFPDNIDHEQLFHRDIDDQTTNYPVTNYSYQHTLENPILQDCITP